MLIIDCVGGQFDFCCRAQNSLSEYMSRLIYITLDVISKLLLVTKMLGSTFSLASEDGASSTWCASAVINTPGFATEIR